MLPAWTPRGPGAVRGEVCHARWPSGLHVQDKGPAPGRGEGRPGGGAGRRLRPYFGGPQPSSRGIATYTSGWDLFGSLHEVKSLLGGAVYLDPL